MFLINLENFTDFFYSNELFIVLFISLLNGLILYFASVKFILVLQQSGYRYKRYFKWLKSSDTPYRSRLMLLCLLGLLFFCVLNITFIPIVNEEVAAYVGFASYILFVAVYIKTESAVNAKIPIKKTKRIVRLSITYYLTLSAITFGLMILITYLGFLLGATIPYVLRYAILCALPMFMPYVLFVAYCINEPMEAFLRKRHIQRCKNKLKKADVIKIGITGSYGKTSVKEILATLLSQRFRVLATPQSFNTPLGIALSTKKLDNLHDIFIFEMGARQRGDIKELALLTNPSYAILTGVNNQHLETFGSLKEIEDTKYELFECLKDGSLAFFSSDNDISVKLSNRYENEKYLAGASNNNGLVYATDVRVDEQGTSFNLHIKGEKPTPVNSVLLGKHSVGNICLASAVAYKLGLSVEEIASGINRIKSISHRLEIIPNHKNVVLIDDSYNANIDGAMAGLEVLDAFKGRKIVLTPGLIELGADENIANMRFGKQLASHADIVVIIGKHNAEMLINGLKEGGMKVENIYFEKSLTRGKNTLEKILQEGDVVLFENDLPDNYN